MRMVSWQGRAEEIHLLGHEAFWSEVSRTFNRVSYRRTGSREELPRWAERSQQGEGMYQGPKLL